MVGVKVPIAPWSSAQYRSEEGAAKAREKEAMAREQNMALMIEQDVRESVMRLQTAQDKLRQVLQEQVVTAQNALRSAQISYGSGKSDLTMSLDAVRMVLMAKEEAVMAHTGVLLATLNLEKATGVPPGTWLLESTSPQGVPQ
jgi:outer membrane protein TolC